MNGLLGRRFAQFWAGCKDDESDHRDDPKWLIFLILADNSALNNGSGHLTLPLLPSSCRLALGLLVLALRDQDSGVQITCPSILPPSLLDHVDVGGADAILRSELGRAGALGTLGKDDRTHLGRILC